MWTVKGVSVAAIDSGSNKTAAPFYSIFEVKCLSSPNTHLIPQKCWVLYYSTMSFISSERNKPKAPEIVVTPPNND